MKWEIARNVEPPQISLKFWGAEGPRKFRKKNRKTLAQGNGSVNVVQVAMTIELQDCRKEGQEGRVAPRETNCETKRWASALLGLSHCLPVHQTWLASLAEFVMASNTAHSSLPTGWAPLQRQHRDVDAYYHSSSGVCAWSQPFSCDRDEDGLPTEVYEDAMISAYLNFCFFVGEIAFVSYGPTGKVRHTLDMMAHILTGPISFLGFLNGGFMGSFFFFFSLWHFLCDSNRARPSLVRVMPTSREEFWV